MICENYENLKFVENTYVTKNSKIASLMQTKLEEVKANILVCREQHKIQVLEKNRTVKRIVKDKIGVLVNQMSKVLLKRKTTQIAHTQQSNIQQTEYEESRKPNTFKFGIINYGNNLKSNNTNSDLQSNHSKISVTLSKLNKMRNKTKMEKKEVIL